MKERERPRSLRVRRRVEHRHCAAIVRAEDDGLGRPRGIEHGAQVLIRVSSVGVPGLSAPDNPVYGGSAAHAPNEHIRVEDFAPAIEFTIAVLEELGR